MRNYLDGFTITAESFRTTLAELDSLAKTDSYASEITAVCISDGFHKHKKCYLLFASFNDPDKTQVLENSCWPPFTNMDWF